MDDSRARFLSAISQRLGADRIVELHLFSPIRQGVLETGVAVIATAGEGEGSRVWEGEEAECGEGKGAGAEGAPATVEGEAESAPPSSSHTLHPSSSHTLHPSSSHTLHSSSSHTLLPSPSHTLPLPLRLVVHTARYRLTRKGPDRGKWLFECAPTADAPLATVDAVARGVTLRSKDLTESERFTGEQLKQLLEDPAWRTPA